MANQMKENFSVKETKPSIRAKKPLHGPTTSFDLVEEMLYLYVRIEKARGVPVQSHLQVELKIGNYRGATTTTAQSPQGEFNWYQVFAFTKSRLQDTTVHVSVKADGGVVSKCSFGVSEALRRVPPDPQLAAQWYRLADTKGNGFGGELMMAFWTGTQVDEVYNVASHSDAVAALSDDGLLSICPRVYHTPRFSYLRVNVIAAQDLVINDINNRVQPVQVFVEASVLDCKFRTKACSTKTVDPKWNEDLMFVVAEPFDATLVVEVYEKAVVVNGEVRHGERLGRCEIPIKNVGKRTDRTPAASLWYDLKLVPDQPRFASKINMRISLDGGYHVFDDPTDFPSDLRPSAKVLWRPPVGTFELGIMSASGLSPIMPKTSVDTFCVAKYGPKWVRTRTVIDNRSPKWNEQYMWEVFDHCTVITIAVFDNKYLLQGGEVAAHQGIGRVRIRLSDLDSGKVYTNSHPLVSLERSGVMKRGELQLSYRFCPTSKFNVYTRYPEPLLPKLHYILPLSVPQILILRAQAVRLIQKMLQRAQLSGEVVQYVLLDNKYSFSTRRARANFLRCKKLQESFLVCKQQFDRLLSWSNPRHTIGFIIFLIAALCFPSLALASIFFTISGVGAWGYRKRPRQLPHIDTELSQLNSVDRDDIAEEFDGVVTEERHVQLQKLLVVVQTLLGDIAATGERVQSLLSWRDKRATLLVLILSFIAGLVFYFDFLDLRVFFYGPIIWMFMRPFIRGLNLPSYFHNFIRRMPSKIDSML
uniref:multiple C2 and transmembrane domain-containing protein 1-like n=1 Tax=Fragaria vesca subsp. vesca TaxID=101020 RepID=UPI0005CB626C|nr:PREDICTED: multiple C2 and transmembrane domain-containing protein 1-like [Fragaria vesca subsp. vesca]